MSLKDLLHSIVGGVEHAADGLLGGLSPIHGGAVHNPFTAPLAGPTVYQHGKANESIYAPVASQRGFYRDANSGTGWGFSNGDGQVATGVAAPTNPAVGIIGHNGQMGRVGMGGASNAYAVPLVSKIKESDGYGRRGHEPAKGPWWNPWDAQTQKHDKWVTEGGATAKQRHDDPSEMDTVFAALGPYGNGTSAMGTGAMSIAGLLGNLMRRTPALEGEIMEPFAGAARRGLQGALNAAERPLLNAAGRGALEGGGHNPLIGSGDAYAALPSGARKLLNPGHLPIDAQQSLRDYLHYLTTGALHPGSLL